MSASSAVDAVRREQAGRAAADEDAVHAPAPDEAAARLRGRRAARRGSAPRAVRPGAPLVRVEVAVGALLQAPGQVHVERQRRQRRQRQRARAHVARQALGGRLRRRRRRPDRDLSQGARPRASARASAAPRSARWLCAFLVAALELGHAAAERRDEHQRVVAEAARAARRVAGSRRASGPTATSGSGSSAERSATSVLTKRARRSADAAQALAAAARCWRRPARGAAPRARRARQLDAREVRRGHARRAAERVDAQARVVGDRRAAGWPRRMARLGQRVLDEGVVRLLGLGDAERALRHELERQRARTAPAARRASWRCWTPAPAASRQTPSAAFCASDQLADALVGQRQQRVHLGAREGRALGRALHFDEAAGAGHHHVHVGVAGRVFDVLQVEQRRALDDADRDRGDEVADRRGGRACPAPAASSPHRARRRRRR